MKQNTRCFWRDGLAALMFCLTLAGAPHPSAAMYVSGSDLVRDCLSGQDRDVRACVHYVAGVIDYHTAMQAVGTAPTLPFCIPASIGMPEAAFVVLTYLRLNPQHEGFVAAMAVPLALNKAFPCKTPPKGAAKKK
jgi:hypothetical protein